MLKKQVSPKIVAIVFGVIVVVFAIAVYVSAWTEPSAIPPGANVDAPLNVSNTPQQKLGALRLGGLTVDNDTYLATAGGNVGIGTTSTSQKLDVMGYVKGQTGLCIGNDCRTSWPSGSSGYSISCVGGISGSQWPFCCRINISSGLAECRQVSAWPLINWVTKASPFSVGTAGPYSLSCSYGTPGYSYPICCRINSTGTSECKVATSWGLTGWTTVGPDPF